MSLTTIEEMAYTYAILIALTLKPLSEVDTFMKNVKQNISFEWFGDIADIFYNTQSNPIVINSVNYNPLISTLTF